MSRIRAILRNRRAWLVKRGPDSGGAAARLVLHDSFTDADATYIENHTIAPVRPGSAVWAYVGGSIHRIYSNLCRNGSGNATASVAECGVSDVTVRLSFYLAQALSAAGACLRATDANNQWRLYANPTQLVIQDVNASIATTRATTNTTHNTLTWYSAVLTAAGANYSLVVNGVSVSYTAQSAFNQSATLHGPFTRRALDLIEDFKVYTA